MHCLLLRRWSRLKPICVHYLAPRCHKVFHELLLGVGTAIDFCKCAQLGMRAEDQINAGSGPLGLVCLAVTSLVDISRAIRVIRRLPLSFHVEKVDEEIVAQGTGLLSEDSMLCATGVSAQNAQASDQDGHFWRSQPQQLRFIDQHLLRRQALLTAQIITESICPR